MLVDERSCLRELPLTADECRQLRRQVVPRRVQARERGEAVWQVEVAELEDLLGPTEVLEPVTSEIAPRCAGRQSVVDEVARCS